ncbi:MAG: hypothetical protein LC775_10245, partial [Acidobacteria bacterium]|nr:hypothetical protein [Acidobacteriota bacterium]
PTLIGIFYRNASGTIQNVDITSMKLGSGLEGCQSGLGIFVQKLGRPVREVRVLTSTIHDYQKNGITAPRGVLGSGSTGTRSPASGGHLELPKTVSRSALVPLAAPI